MTLSPGQGYNRLCFPHRLGADGIGAIKRIIKAAPAGIDSVQRIGH